MQHSKLTSKAPTKVVHNKGNDETIKQKVSDDSKTDIKRVAKTPTKKVVKKPENNYVVIDKTKKVNNYVTITTNKKYEIEDCENDYYELSPNETINFTNKRIIKLTNAKDSDSDYELTPEEILNIPKKRIIKTLTKVIQKKLSTGYTTKVDENNIVDIFTKSLEKFYKNIEE